MTEKISILDVKEVVDFPLRLLGDLFQRYLSVKHIAYLVTHVNTQFPMTNFQGPQTIFRF